MSADQFQAVGSVFGAYLSYWLSELLRPQRYGADGTDNIGVGAIHGGVAAWSRNL